MSGNPKRPEAFRSSYPLVILSLWAFGLAVLVSLSLWSCDGLLIYTLDDPYIHMAVSERILQGGYGINLGEFSAPCSSILYPFLLAVTEKVGLGMYGPLAINTTAMAFVILGVGKIISDYLIPRGEQASSDKVLYICTGSLLCFCVNGLGLVMTGMEHSLHLLAVVVVVREMLRIGKYPYAPISWRIVSCIVALPLIRFEGAAMAGLAILLLWLIRRRHEAILSSVLLLVALGCWFGFMKFVGLPPFPSSVQLKSSVVYRIAEQHDVWRIVYSTGGNVWGALKQRQGVVFVALMAILAWRLKVSPKSGGHARYIATAALVGGILHLLFGRFGWFSRYEIYALLPVLLGCLLVFRGHLHLKWARLACMGALLLICLPYIETTVKSPAASKNIYQQQYQMNQFIVHHWKRPVAVNDLGWASYRNPYYVLDLYGLGSERVRRLRLAGTWNAEKMAELARDRQVGLVMIYEEWYAGCLPSSWRKVAVLQTSKVTSASAEVSFYATESACLSELRGMLVDFSKTLPAGSILRIE